MWSVYIIRSKSNPEQRYIGLTENLKARLQNHNAGGSIHTAKFRPWALETVISFSEKSKAAAFENPQSHFNPGLKSCTVCV